ncbi:MAG TPA: MBL fold metallo-hydrolase [Verrucomicrobiales bacterium]|nr:MBL fold metallo-hydrolase [Verrucomicrobiales bacterium]
MPDSPLEPAYLKGEAFLRDVAAHGACGDALALWWLGQSGFLVRSGGRSVIIDPYLSDSLTEKYAGTDKPHDRITERIVDPAFLEGIDAATSSHLHTDHCDAATLLPLTKANPSLTLVLPAANLEAVRERLGSGAPELLTLDRGGMADVEGIVFHGVAAAHNAVERDSQARCRFLGYVIGIGPWRIYHSGDTLWHDDLVAEVLPHRPHVALLPINGNKPERGVAGNLNGAEAAALARALGVRLAIPCHYGMFRFNTEPPALFEETCLNLGQAFRTLRQGESVVIEAC